MVLLTSSLVLNLGFTPLLVEAAAGAKQANLVCWCPGYAGKSPLTPEAYTPGTSIGCCLFGPDGFFLRGEFVDLTSGWYAR